MQRNQTNTLHLPLSSRKPLEQEMQIAQLVNQMEESQKSKLDQEVHSYFKTLAINQLKDRAIVTDNKPSFLSYIGLIIGFPIYLLGRLLNFIPLYLGNWWAANKVREIVFFAPIRVSFSLGAYIFYTLFLLLTAIIMGQTWFWLSLLAIPVLGYFSLYYYDFKTQWKEQQQASKIDPAIINSLRTKRIEIQRQISASLAN